MFTSFMAAELTLVVIGLGLMALVFGIGVLMTSGGVRCARCTKKLHKNEVVKFLGVPMCESCENIASYYNQKQ